jgi:hypothetical protein
LLAAVISFRIAELTGITTVFRPVAVAIRSAAFVALRSSTNGTTT